MNKRLPSPSVHRSRCVLAIPVPPGLLTGYASIPQLAAKNINGGGGGNPPGEGGEGVWGEYYREGYNKNPPVNYEGGGCIFGLYK